MYNNKAFLLTNYIELFLAENSCTISDVEEVIEFLVEDIKIQKKTHFVKFNPSTALLCTGLVDYMKKDILINTDFDNIDALKFLNNDNYLPR